jgi:glycosyltransferase involved in cell wall biosynthesis
VVRQHRSLFYVLSHKRGCRKLLVLRPTISVIIPTYNEATFLPDAIGSVRAQSWPHLEIIVVDDGSVDDTESVLHKLAGSDLRSISQVNSGPAAARNRGIAEARGEWIAFLDADDFWLPNKLDAQFQEISRHPEAAFCYTDVKVRYPNGMEHDLQRGITSGTLLLELVRGNLLATPTIVVRRNCFDKIGVFNVELRTGEDWDLWLRLAARFPSIYLPQPLTICRVELNSGRYSVQLIEHCTLRVLEHLFSCREIMQLWPELPRLRRQVYAWHYSVLAKSYFRSRRLTNCFRFVLNALRSHPSGLRYLAPRGHKKGAYL